MSVTTSTSTSTRASRRAREIVVIGAGVGGLAAAVRLSERGHRVTVLEQAAAIGGKLGMLERDGYSFDTGPSLVTLPGELLAVTSDALRLRLRRLDPICRYRFGDGTWWDAPADEAAMEGAAEALRPGAGAQWRTFHRRAETIWEASRQPFLESPLRGARTLLAQSWKVRSLRAIAPGQSLSGLARSHFDDERLVTFVERYATYSGSDPRKAPAALAAVPYVERHYGGWYLEGGLRAIADSMADRASSAGAVIRTSADVVAIEVDGDGRACGVRTADGTMHRADVVVSNADAAEVYGRLLAERIGSAPSHRSVNVGVRHARRRLTLTTTSFSGFVILLGVERGIESSDSLAEHNVLFARRYHDEFDDLQATRMVRDPTIYAHVPSDPAVAPPGYAAWFVLVNAPLHDPAEASGINWDVPGRADAYADRILEVLAQRGVDVRPFVRFREIRTPADLQRRTRAVGGAIYGTSSNGARAAFLRPRNRTPVPGLYLVGGSSHPGGGLPLVLLSARIVDRLIAEDLRDRR